MDQVLVVYGPILAALNRAREIASTRGTYAEVADRHFGNTERFALALASSPRALIVLGFPTLDTWVRNMLMSQAPTIEFNRHGWPPAVAVKPDFIFVTDDQAAIAGISDNKRFNLMRV